MEELLLLCPENYLYHLQYADILYTLGGKDNYKLSAQYYAQSIELNSTHNVRALYGYLLATKAAGLVKNYQGILYKKIQQKIIDTYDKKDHDQLVDIVKKSLETTKKTQ